MCGYKCAFAEASALAGAPRMVRFPNTNFRRFFGHQLPLFRKSQADERENLGGRGASRSVSQRDRSHSWGEQKIDRPHMAWLSFKFQVPGRLFRPKIRPIGKADTKEPVLAGVFGFLRLAQNFLGSKPLAEHVKVGRNHRQSLGRVILG